ncbi:hypothetical protein CPE01_05300 [Cellulomonas persica]|uniref:Uncharacterized protein n=1 Tax=Cellulomonas persica TaxID=76861 RepID=A0A510UQ47_9CELL|nr:hypothetical protein CPE01_05300 [Cellulomonas persica]
MAAISPATSETDIPRPSSMTVAPYLRAAARCAHTHAGGRREDDRDGLVGSAWRPRDDGAPPRTWRDGAP